MSSLQKPVLSPEYEATPKEPSGYDPNQQKSLRQFYTRAGVIHGKPGDPVGIPPDSPWFLITVSRHAVLRRV